MPALSLRWSFGNYKLKKTRTVSFNLPALRAADGFVVCPQAGVCASVCYARQGRYMLPEAKHTRELNLAIVRADLALFERLAVSDLERIRQRIIRVHDSGDFFSQAYLDAWLRVAARFERKRFYCYSKSLHLDWSRRPANFRLVQSMGGKLDGRIDVEAPHTRIFVSHAERRAAGYLDGNRTDRPAIEGRTRIGFVYHGSRQLSEGVLMRLLRPTKGER